MALKLNNHLTPEEIKDRENITDMAKLIVEEMKKRGLQPTDAPYLTQAIEREVYNQTKEIWK